MLHGMQRSLYLQVGMTLSSAWRDHRLHSSCTAAPSLRSIQADDDNNNEHISMTVAGVGPLQLRHSRAEKSMLGQVASCKLQVTVQCGCSPMPFACVGYGQMPMLLLLPLKTASKQFQSNFKASPDRL